MTVGLVWFALCGTCLRRLCVGAVRPVLRCDVQSGESLSCGFVEAVLLPRTVRGSISGPAHQTFVLHDRIMLTLIFFVLFYNFFALFNHHHFFHFFIFKITHHTNLQKTL